MIKKSDERLISENLCHEVCHEVREEEDDVQRGRRSTSRRKNNSRKSRAPVYLLGKVTVDKTFQKKKGEKTVQNLCFFVGNVEDIRPKNKTKENF